MKEIICTHCGETVTKRKSLMSFPLKGRICRTHTDLIDKHTEEERVKKAREEAEVRINEETSFTEKVDAHKEDLINRIRLRADVEPGGIDKVELCLLEDLKSQKLEKGVYKFNLRLLQDCIIQAKVLGPILNERVGAVLSFLELRRQCTDAKC